MTLKFFSHQAVDPSKIYKKQTREMKKKLADLWLMHHTLLITHKYTSFSLKKEVKHGGLQSIPFPGFL